MDASSMKSPRFDEYSPASEFACRVKRANTREGGAAERMLRCALWHCGLRFRKHFGALPGSPDIVFTRQQVCVFVDGDFWHGRDWQVLREKLLHRANASYWTEKIDRNRQRDAEQTQWLLDAGWVVLRFWETDVLRDVEKHVNAVQSALLSKTAKPAIVDRHP